MQETAVHLVQQCFRTHEGRIMRHDAVASILAGELQRRLKRTPRACLSYARWSPKTRSLVAAKGERGCSDNIWY